MKRKRIPDDLRAWIEARQRHHLSHAHVQMTRELGMNPKRLGGLGNHRQELVAATVGTLRLDARDALAAKRLIAFAQQAVKPSAQKDQRDRTTVDFDWRFAREPGQQRTMNSLPCPRPSLNAGLRGHRRRVQVDAPGTECLTGRRR